MNIEDDPEGITAGGGDPWWWTPLMVTMLITVPLWWPPFIVYSVLKEKTNALRRQ